MSDVSGCSGIDSIVIIEFAKPLPEISGDTSFCFGDSVALSSGNFQEYIWSNSESTATIQIDIGQDLSLTVTDENGCTGSTSQLVIEFDSIEFVILGQLGICNGTETMLDAGIYETYLWSTGAVTQTIIVNSEGDYSVTVTDLNGCTASRSVQSQKAPILIQS